MNSFLSTKKYSDFKKKIRYSKYFNSFDPSVKLPDKKFLIYTRGRTGSTVLTDLLNSHPEMYCDYEIFDLKTAGSIISYPLRYIKSCSKRATLNKKRVYGFKVKIEQLKNEHKYEKVDEIIRSFLNDGWKIIYLKRSNIFRHTISGIVSNQTKVFHVKNNKKFEHEKIIIDCHFLIGVMGYFEELDNLEEESLKSIPHLRISYEEDLLDNSRHQSASDKVFSYLEMKSHPVNTTLKKIIPENLENLILNYDEVISYIRKSKFGKYLD